MAQFSEMLNLFVMMCHGLGVMLLTDFFQFAIFDAINLRGEDWELAHETLLIMFRRAEDSDGRPTWANIYDEI